MTHEALTKQLDRGFSQTQWLFIGILGVSVSIRQVAMTMVMPFLSVYSRSLTHYSPVLAGVALGIFGLGQAIFQVPFGIWSDRIGNKKMILAGLFLVITGLLLAYTATDMYLFIAARALQGSGAIIAVVFSWVSNEIHSDKRIKAVSILSTSIAFAAAASFAVGPLIHRFLPVDSMFLICAIIITISWFLILVFLKESETVKMPSQADSSTASYAYIRTLLKNRTFVSLNLLSFLNNYIMTAVFYMIPIDLIRITGLNGMWKIFMPAVFLALLIMKWIVPLAEKGYSIRLLQIASFLCSAGIVCFFYQGFYTILLGSSLFMTSYICIATLAQNEANNGIEKSRLGTANGVFNSFQYLGSFAGSVATGFAWGVQPNLALILTFIVSFAGIGFTFLIRQR